MNVLKTMESESRINVASHSGVGEYLTLLSRSSDWKRIRDCGYVPLYNCLLVACYGESAYPLLGPGKVRRMQGASAQEWGYRTVLWKGGLGFVKVRTAADRRVVSPGTYQCFRNILILSCYYDSAVGENQTCTTSCSVASSQDLPLGYSETQEILLLPLFDLSSISKVQRPDWIGVGITTGVTNHDPEWVRNNNGDRGETWMNKLNRGRADSFRLNFATKTKTAFLSQTRVTLGHLF